MYRGITNIGVVDAPQRALAFLINQAQRIEREVYQVQYADIQYPNLVPVDQTGPEWVSGVTYFSSDAVGRAQWFHGKGDDVPHADILREKFETVVSMAAIGYDYDLEELGRAMQLGIDLRADKAAAARRASEEFIDKVAMFGDTTKGYTGLINNASVTAGSAAATGTGSATTFASKTPDNVLADINGVLTGLYTGTVGAEMADTLLLPYAQLLDLSTRRIDTVNQTTILEWVERNNIYTRQTGGQLTIRGVWGLETAGSGSTARLVAYRRDPSVVTLYNPMPFQFLQAWQQGPMKFEVPGIMRISGVEVRRTKSFRYLDGV
jgi:hypothetical protein